MLPELLGGLRLALLFPLFCCLVVIDEKARWAATACYVLSIAAGAVLRRIPRTGRPRTLAALEPIATPLLVLTVTLGLTVGAASTIGPAGAGVVIVGRALARREFARTRPVFAGPPTFADQVVARLTVPAFILMITPFGLGWPLIDAHKIGSWLFMACGLLAFGLFCGDLLRARRAPPVDAG